MVSGTQRGAVQGGGERVVEGVGEGCEGVCEGVCVSMCVCEGAVCLIKGMNVGCHSDY